MPKPTPWLLGAAALALTAGAAFANEQAARREALDDSAKAQSREDRGERRHVHIRRDGDDVVVMRRGGSAEHLKDILQLRPEQEPALKAFLEATRSADCPREHMVKFDRGEHRSTLQRLDEMAAKLTEQQAQARRRIAAIRAFYGQLDETQRKAFDALPMLMMVGPSMGPMMIPHPVHIAHHMPEPPAPPKPPRPPEP